MIRRGSWDDFDAVYALIATPESRPDFLRSRWEMPSFDPARHLWLAEEDGRATAFGALYAPDQAAVRGNVERVGALLAEVETQARADGLAQLTFVLPEWDEPAWRAYERAGFELVTDVLEMAVPLEEPPPEPAPSDGFVFRTYAGADAHAVHALLDDAYIGWDDAYVPMTHDDWLAFMTDHESFDPDCWFLAESNGDLTGVCLNWKEGWVKDIAVAPAFRRRGLGEALMRHAFARLYARGVRRIGLKVDARNPTSAIRLYERLGMEVERRYRGYLKRL